MSLLTPHLTDELTPVPEIITADEPPPPPPAIGTKSPFVLTPT